MRETFHIQLEFKIQDMWVGLYWEKRRVIWRSGAWVTAFTGEGTATRTDCWICCIPCFPIHVSTIRPDR